MSDSTNLRIDIKAFAQVTKAIADLEKLRTKIQSIEKKGESRGGLTSTQQKQLKRIKDDYANQTKVIGESIEKQEREVSAMRKRIKRRSDALTEGKWEGKDLTPQTRAKLTKEVNDYKKAIDDRQKVIRNTKLQNLQEELKDDKRVSEVSKRSKDRVVSQEQRDELARQKQIDKDHRSHLKTRARERIKADDEEIKQTVFANRKKQQVFQQENKKQSKETQRQSKIEQQQKEREFKNWDKQQTILAKQRARQTIQVQEQEQFALVDKSLGSGRWTAGYKASSKLSQYTPEQLLAYRKTAMDKLKTLPLESKDAQRYVYGIRQVNNELTKLGITGGKMQSNLITPINKFAHAAFNLFGLSFVFQRIGTAFRQLVTRGAEFETMSNAFKGTMEDMANMRKASEGMLSDEKILGFSNKAQDLGIQMKEMPIFIDMALRSMKNYGIQLDDLPQVLEKVIKTTQTAQKELTSLGIPRPAFMGLVKKYSRDIIMGGDLTKDIHKGDTGQYQYEREKLEATDKARENYLLKLNEEHQTRVKIKALIELYGKSLDDVTNKEQSTVGKVLSLSAAIENFSNRLGQSLLPVAEKAFTPIITGLEWITQNSERVATAFGILSAALTVFTIALVRMGALKANPLFVIMTALAAVATIAVPLSMGTEEESKSLEGFSNTMKKVAKELKESTDKIAALRVKLPELLSQEQDDYSTNKELSERIVLLERLKASQTDLMRWQLDFMNQKQAADDDIAGVYLTPERIAATKKMLLQLPKTGGESVEGTLFEIPSYVSPKQKEAILSYIEKLKKVAEESGIKMGYGYKKGTGEFGSGMWDMVGMGVDTENMEAMNKLAQGIPDISNAIDDLVDKSARNKETLMDSQYIRLLADHFAILGDRLRALEGAFEDGTMSSAQLDQSINEVRTRLEVMKSKGVDAGLNISASATEAALSIMGISDSAIKSIDSLQILGRALQLIQDAKWYEGEIEKQGIADMVKFGNYNIERTRKVQEGNQLINSLEALKTEGENFKTPGGSSRGGKQKPHMTTGSIDRTLKELADMGTYLQILNNQFTLGQISVEAFQKKLNDFITIGVPEDTKEMFNKLSSIFTEGGFLTIGKALETQVDLTGEQLAAKYEDIKKIVDDNAADIQVGATTLKDVIEKHLKLQDQFGEKIKYQVDNEETGKSSVVDELEKEGQTLLFLSEIYYQLQYDRKSALDDLAQQFNAEVQLGQYRIDSAKRLLELENKRLSIQSDNIRSNQDILDMQDKELSILKESYRIREDELRLNPFDPNYQKNLDALKEEYELDKLIIDKQYEMQVWWEAIDMPNKYAQLLNMLRMRSDTKEGALRKDGVSFLDFAGISDYTVVETFFGNVKDIMVDSFSEGWEMVFGEANSMFEQLMQQFAQQITEMLLQRGIAALLNLIFSVSTGGVSGGISAILGGASGAIARASGGSVFPGQMYQVNERGMEMFMTNQKGYILDANRTSQFIAQGQAMKQQNTSVNVYIAGVLDGQKFLRKEFPRYENFKRLMRC